MFTVPIDLVQPSGEVMGRGGRARSRLLAQQQVTDAAQAETAKSVASRMARLKKAETKVRLERLSLQSKMKGGAELPLLAIPEEMQPQTPSSRVTEPAAGGGTPARTWYGYMTGQKPPKPPAPNAGTFIAPPSPLVPPYVMNGGIDGGDGGSEHGSDTTASSDFSFADSMADFADMADSLASSRLHEAPSPQRLQLSKRDEAAQRHLETVSAAATHLFLKDRPPSSIVCVSPYGYDVEGAAHVATDPVKDLGRRHELGLLEVRPDGVSSSHLGLPGSALDGKNSAWVSKPILDVSTRLGVVAYQGLAPRTGHEISPTTVQGLRTFFLRIHAELVSAISRPDHPFHGRTSLATDLVVCGETVIASLAPLLPSGERGVDQRKNHVVATGLSSLSLRNVVSRTFLRLLEGEPELSLSAVFLPLWKLERERLSEATREQERNVHVSASEFGALMRYLGHSCGTANHAGCLPGACHACGAGKNFSASFRSDAAAAGLDPKEFAKSKEGIKMLKATAGFESYMDVWEYLQTNQALVPVLGPRRAAI
jgi:hypothetical protein